MLLAASCWNDAASVAAAPGGSGSGPDVPAPDVPAPDVAAQLPAPSRMSKAAQMARKTLLDRTLGNGRRDMFRPFLSSAGLGAMPPESGQEPLLTALATTNQQNWPPTPKKELPQ